MNMSSGDIAWVIVATALVMLMTPALGFFYAGLVRRKNMLSTLVQCLIIFAVVSLVWTLWGYSLVFGPSIRGVIGDLSRAGLANVGTAPYAGYAFLRTGFDSPDDIKMVVTCGNAESSRHRPNPGSFLLDAYGDLLVHAPGINSWGRQSGDRHRRDLAATQ